MFSLGGRRFIKFAEAKVSMVPDRFKEEFVPKNHYQKNYSGDEEDD